MQILLGELSAYGLQAWLVSVTGAALGITKAVLMVKGSRTIGNGNGKLMLAKDEGKFEVQILSLTERVVRLNELIHQTQKADHDKWSPAIMKLMESQTKMMKILDKHNQLAEEHRDRMQTIWGDMLGVFVDTTEKLDKMPCTKDEREDR